MPDRKNPLEYLRSAADSLKEAREMHGLKRQMRDCRAELSRELEAYGRACLMGREDAQAHRQSAETLQMQSQALEKRMDDLSGIRRCAGCGLALEEGDAYCRRCGCARKRNGAAHILWPEETSENPGDPDGN